MEEQFENDIFISYSKKDKDVVYKYVDILVSKGYNVWIDKDGLMVGAKYTEKIVDAIESSQVFLFFSSVHSNESKWTQGEVIAAHNMGKPIVPIVLDGSSYNKSIMLLMLPLNHIDCTKMSETDSNEKILSTMKSLIGDRSVVGKEDGHEQYLNLGQKVNNKINYLVVSSIFAIVLSVFWYYFSGEQYINNSLSLFVAIISAITSCMSNNYLLSNTNNWNLRNYITNYFLLFGIDIFITFSVMALGLGFANLTIMKLNFPSALCSLFAIISIYLVMLHKKIGYWLLCACACLFCIGANWWLGNVPSYYLYAFIAVVISSILFFTIILRLPKNGTNTWKMLK